MRRALALVALVGAVIVSTSAGAATAADTDGPGVPGDANCVGQTLSYYATNHGFGTSGIGGLVHYQGRTVQDLKGYVVSYCSNTPPPPPPPPPPPSTP